MRSKILSLLLIFPVVLLLAIPELAISEIKYPPQDNVVRLYGAGGPHTALQKVADLWQQRTGETVEIVAGPEKTWSKEAQTNADILWGTAQQSMSAFLATYPSFASDEVKPIYIRPAVIAVKRGNPKRIRGFDDLLRDDIRIIVTEGLGVSNTSGTGVWEDIAGRLGRLQDIQAFRENIVSFETGSGASFNAFQELDADAWITWPNWPATRSDVLEVVALSPDRAIWRDLSIAISSQADPVAHEFVTFLISEEAAELMATEGWVR